MICPVSDPPGSFVSLHSNKGSIGVGLGRRIAMRESGDERGLGLDNEGG